MSQNSRRSRKSRFRHGKGDFKRDSAHEKIPGNEFVHRTMRDDRENIQKQEDAKRELKSRKVICAKCGQPIGEISCAIADKNTGAPVHFDCVLDELKEKEHLAENERLEYIGQGRFAVLRFDNVRDQKYFKIVKTIEWEPRDATYEWRTEMSGIYSQVM